MTKGVNTLVECVNNYVRFLLFEELFNDRNYSPIKARG